MAGEVVVPDSDEIESGLIRGAVVVGYLLFGISASMPFFAFVRFPFPESLVFFLMTVFLFLPFFILADMLAAVIIVDGNGVERLGLFHRRTFISWNDLTWVKLIRGTAGFREIIIKSHRKKIAFSSGLLLLPRRNFWPAAAMIVHRADMKDIEVKAGWPGRDVWFAPGRTIQDED